MQDSLNSGTTPAGGEATTAPPAPLPHKPSAFSSSARNGSAAHSHTQQQQPQQPPSQHNQPTNPNPLHGLRPVRPLPPKQPSPTTETAADDSPRAASTPADEDTPSAAASAAGDNDNNSSTPSHVTIADGVVTSSSTDDAGDAAENKDAAASASAHEAQQQHRQQQHHHLPGNKKVLVNGFVKPEASSTVTRKDVDAILTDELAAASSIEDLKQVLMAMKADMVSREEHEKLVEELRVTKRQVETLSAKLERQIRLGN